MIPLETFDPENISKKDCQNFADHLEEYLEVLEDIMIFPKEMKKKDKEKMQDAIHQTKKLIKKLRKGDRSVFKDPDEFNDMF